MSAYSPECGKINVDFDGSDGFAGFQRIAGVISKLELELAEEKAKPVKTVTCCGYDAFKQENAELRSKFSAAQEARVVATNRAQHNMELAGAAARERDRYKDLYQKSDSQRHDMAANLTPNSDIWQLQFESDTRSDSDTYVRVWRRRQPGDKE